jgi:endo-1,4-beta-xylanase
MIRLRVLGVAFVCVVGTTAPVTLREAADRAEILVGTALRPALFSEAAYSRTLGREFNMVEPEDAMKWWTVRHEREEFDFKSSDEVVRFAQAHRMKVRGHCLIWDHNNPTWLADGNFTPPQLAKMMQEHISTTMKHYAGQVFAWDVVNEGLNEDGTFKDSIWYNKPGIGMANKNSAYIEQAFRWARDADSKPLLFYNENGSEGLGKKSDALYAMVRDFRSRGVPIDGVGLQMHVDRLDYDTEAVEKYIARLTALGILVHITELDVSLPVDAQGVARREDLERQAALYRGIVHACLQNTECTAIQTWGFTDTWSWIGSHSHHTRGAALPFDGAYRPKPAYRAILEEIAARSK